MKEEKIWADLAAAAGLVVRAVAGDIRSAFGRVTSGMAEEKGHNSLVSEVDRLAEERLVEGLSRLLPGSAFLTEEAVVAQSAGRQRWIIDPLDGTTNFLFGVPLFCISVALEQEGELVLGLVHDVMADEQYVAWKGGGAWCNGQALRVSATAHLAQSLLATGFPYYDYAGTAAYLQVLEHFMRHTRGIRRLGSAALDLAWTARGRFDGFYEYGLHPWDVAGGAVLVREAGGMVSDFEGGPQYLHGKTLIAGNAAIREAVQSAINSYFSRG